MIQVHKLLYDGCNLPFIQPSQLPSSPSSPFLFLFFLSPPFFFFLYFFYFFLFFPFPFFSFFTFPFFPHRRSYPLPSANSSSRVLNLSRGSSLSRLLRPLPFLSHPRWPASSSWLFSPRATTSSPQRAPATSSLIAPIGGAATVEPHSLLRISLPAAQQ